MLETISPLLLCYIFFILTFAGFVKGVVGFAFPMITYSFLSLIFSPENTVAILIFPTIIMNLIQLFHSKLNLKNIKLKKTYSFILILTVTLFFTTQIYYFLPVALIIYSMAFFIITFSFMPNKSFLLDSEHKYFNFIKLLIGMISGFFGGISGIWGPPTVVYLLMLKLKKNEFIFLQSIIFLIGSIFLIIGHFLSGLIKLESSLISIFFIVPSIIGFILGVFFRKKINTFIFFRLVRLILFFSGIAMIINF